MLDTIRSQRQLSRRKHALTRGVMWAHSIRDCWGFIPLPIGVSEGREQHQLQCLQLVGTSAVKDRIHPVLARPDAAGKLCKACCWHGCNSQCQAGNKFLARIMKIQWRGTVSKVRAASALKYPIQSLAGRLQVSHSSCDTAISPMQIYQRLKGYGPKC